MTERFPHREPLAGRLPPQIERPGLVTARIEGGLVHVRLRGFTEADLEAIKAIPGRRWVRERKVWTVPNTQDALDALGEAFGSRLLIGPTSSSGEGGDRAANKRSRVAAGPPSSPEAARDSLRNRPIHPLPPHDEPPPHAGRQAPPPRTDDAVLEALSLAVRTREYSPRTERAYMDWARRFMNFRAPAAPPGASLDPAQGRAFLEHLATDARLSAKTRNQAASALGFMFREVLGLDGFQHVPRAKGPQRLPVVLSHREVLRVLRELAGDHRLIVSLLYSAGLRLDECLGIRVKDVDFELRQILVRDGKGKKDRYVPLAHRAIDALRVRVLRRGEQHEQDRAQGHGWASLPGALDRKDPGAGFELGWQVVFPARTPSRDPATGRMGRRHLHPTAVQREVKRAVRRSGVGKRASCHTFRHSFATEALRGGCDIRTLQHVLGHKDVRTTMIYLHVVEQTGFYVRSPLDRPSDPDDPDWEPSIAPAPPVAVRPPSGTITPTKSPNSTS
ncbi:MAG: integron integrase [Gemmatimonadota bacterium]